MRRLFVVLSALLISMNASGLTVAMVQYDADPHFGDTQGNLATLAGMADQAVRNGASLIVLPEGSSHGYARPGKGAKRIWCTSTRQSECRDVRDVAEKLTDTDGVVAFWSAYAARTGATIVASVIEEDGGRYYNTAATIGPKGLIASYRKRALYYIDEYYATPGSAPVVADLGFGKVGFMICADGNFDDQYLEYKRLGVSAIVLTMDWDQSPNPTSPRSARNFFAAHAQASGLPIIAADVSRWDGTGLYLPDGTRVRRGLPDVAPGVDGITYAEIP